MVAVRTRFDGEKIEIPSQLRGAAPGDVILIFDPTTPAAQPTSEHSIWDVVGKASTQRSAAELDQQIREERDSWTER